MVEQCLGDSKIVITGENSIEAYSGETLLVCKKETAIRVRGYNMIAAPGTIVLLDVTAAGFMASVVGDQKKDSLAIMAAGNKRVCLSIGSSYRYRTKSARNSYRKKMDLDDQSSMAEVSLISLFHNLAVMSAIHKSEQKEDKLLSLSLLKSAVCMNIVTSSHGPFSEF